MKNKTTMIPAFSIIEAVVGMAITAIVMGLIFVIFSIMSERILDYKLQNKGINDMNRFTYTMNKDLFESEKLTLSDRDIKLKGYSGIQVHYQFLPDVVIRNNETFTDTFEIKLMKIHLDSMHNKSNRIFFNKLSLDVEINQKAFPLRWYKPVYANELLEVNYPK